LKIILTGKRDALLAFDSIYSLVQLSLYVLDLMRLVSYDQVRSGRNEELERKTNIRLKHDGVVLVICWCLQELLSVLIVWVLGGRGARSSGNATLGLAN